MSDLVPGGAGVIDRIIIVFCYQREPLFGAEIAFQVAKLSKITSLSFILCYKFGSKNSVNCFWFSFVNISVRGP